MSPAVQKIFALPVEKRIDAFIELWKDLNEFTGCRTLAERNAMAEIGDAILPTLIRERESRSNKTT